MNRFHRPVYRPKNAKEKVAEVLYTLPEAFFLSCISAFIAAAGFAFAATVWLLF